MYHRFNEPKYPSTNVQMNIFKEQIKIIESSNAIFIDPTNLDKEGRFLIPENLKAYANISSQAIFIGQGHFFQIWEPKAALERQEQSRLRLIKEKKTLASIISNIGNTNE